MINGFRIPPAFKSAILYFSLMMLTTKIGFGQDDILYFHKGNEGFSNLAEGVIKNEIAFFSYKAASNRNSIAKSQLNEISLKRCSDSSVYFEKGNIYASEIIVGIYAEKTAKARIIKKIKYIHYTFGFCLPDSTITDIYAPVFCTEYTKKGKPVASSCKVYQSEDKRRIYIYMLNGQGKTRYEVTFVIQDDKYFTRVIDVIN